MDKEEVTKKLKKKKDKLKEQIEEIECILDAFDEQTTLS
jgi:prefoldin subunit 5